MCKKTTISPFGMIPVDHLADLKWKGMVNGFQLKAPLHFTVQQSIVLERPQECSEGRSYSLPRHPLCCCNVVERKEL